MIPTTNTAKIAILSLLFALGIANPSLTFSAEYTLQPSIQLIGTYNDNVSFSATSDDNDPLKENNDISGATYRSAIDFNRNTRRTNFNLSGNVSFNRFNLTQFDSDDQNLSVNYNIQFEKGSLFGSTSWRKETTRTFEDTNTGDGSVERIAARAQATQLSVGGNYSINERQSLQGSFFALRQDYATQNLVDYSYFSASGLWQFILNERYRLQSRGTYSRYLPQSRSDITFLQSFFDAVENEGLSQEAIEAEINECREIGFFFIPNQTNPTSQGPCFSIGNNFHTIQNTAQLELGLVVNFNEKTSFDVLIGRNETGTRSDGSPAPITPPSRSKRRSISYEASLNHQQEKLNLSLNGTRKDETTARGGLQLTQRVNANSRWNFSKYNYASAGITWFKRKANLSDTFFSSDQEDYISRLNYHHRLSQDWSATLTYRYRQQKRAINSTSTESTNRYRNEVLISLNWRPNSSQW